MFRPKLRNITKPIKNKYEGNCYNSILFYLIVASLLSRNMYPSYFSSFITKRSCVKIICNFMYLIQYVQKGKSERVLLLDLKIKKKHKMCAF